MYNWIIKTFVIPAVVKGIKEGVEKTPFVREALKNLDKVTVTDIIAAITKETETKTDDKVLEEFLNVQSTPVYVLVKELLKLIKSNKVNLDEIWATFVAELKKEL